MVPLKIGYFLQTRFFGFGTKGHVNFFGIFVSSPVFNLLGYNYFAIYWQFVKPDLSLWLQLDIRQENND